MEELALVAVEGTRVVVVQIKETVRGWRGWFIYSGYIHFKFGYKFGNGVCYRNKIISTSLR
jgi:hypothetical protein